MTLQDIPDDHDRFLLPQTLPREWGGEIRESLATFIVIGKKLRMSEYVANTPSKGATAEEK
jgi:hypothetical protein